jgi:hypothetical protein
MKQLPVLHVNKTQVQHEMCGNLEHPKQQLLQPLL